MDPLEVAVLSPDVITTRPPVDDEADVVPPASTSSLPWPLVPLPTVTYTEPARALLAAPDPKYTAPLALYRESPDEIEITPLEPELAVPEPT
jgi:hypothetical protein